MSRYGLDIMLVEDPGRDSDRYRIHKLGGIASILDGNALWSPIGMGSRLYIEDIDHDQ